MRLMCGLVHRFFSNRAGRPQLSSMRSSANTQVLTQHAVLSRPGLRSPAKVGLNVKRYRESRWMPVARQHRSTWRWQPTKTGGQRRDPQTILPTARTQAHIEPDYPRHVNAWAHSSARKSGAGMCKAARAVVSLTALQLDASTP